jgi:hypothetical protein
MSLPPVVASLTRHKLTALLLVLQVSLTCAIVCNVAFMIANRTTQLRQPSGVAEDELVMVDSTDLDDNAQPLVRHATDLAALRAISGVTSVAAVDALPFNGNDWSNGISLVPDARRKSPRPPTTAHRANSPRWVFIWSKGAIFSRTNTCPWIVRTIGRVSIMYRSPS